MTIDEEVKAAKVPALQHPTVWKRTGARGRWEMREQKERQRSHFLTCGSGEAQSSYSVYEPEAALQPAANMASHLLLYLFAVICKQIFILKPFHGLIKAALLASLIGAILNYLTLRLQI